MFLSPINFLVSPHTKGWQSYHICNYPQELGFALEAPARVTQVGDGNGMIHNPSYLSTSLTAA